MALFDVRYQRLGYVALNVSDLARARRFYSDIVGLHAEAAGPDEVLLRCSDRRFDILLRAGEPGLKRAAWQMEDANALEALRGEMAKAGVKVTPVPRPETDRLGLSEAFRISEPITGAVFEFYVDMALASGPFAPTHTKIARLGHVVLNSPDREATERFLTDHMNFRVSDRIEGFVSFMRCFPNPYHHSMGVGSGPEPGLNHVNFMVTDLDDVGRAFNRMKANDVPIVYGMGKHPPSESVFLYFLDPDGITVEYSYGMEEFPEAGAREPRMMGPTLDSIDYWGGVPDPRFAKTGRIEAATDASA